MAAVARSRELDHKQAFAPTRGLLEEYWNTFNEPRRMILIYLLVLSRLVSESNYIFKRGTFGPPR